jgi:hypothetical protein
MIFLLSPDGTAVVQIAVQKGVVLSLTATVTATRGEQLWTLANNHELWAMKNSANMDGGEQWWT